MHIDISAALSLRLSTLNIPTAWENSTFTPTVNVLYLKEQFLSGETFPFGLSQTDTVGGIYQVTVMSPKGATKGAGINAAQQVLSLYPRGLRLQHGSQKVTIMSASLSPAFDVGDRYAWVVSIRFWAAL